MSSDYEPGPQRRSLVAPIIRALAGLGAVVAIVIGVVAGMHQTRVPITSHMGVYAVPTHP